MQKFQRVIRNAYLRLCYAGLQEDMAQRIMYSVLPHLADSSQVMMTGGVVDPTALKAAIEGRKNILRYGVEAVLQELNHYKNEEDDSNHPWQRAINFVRAGKTEEALDVAVDAFSDVTGWGYRYGGRAWEMIAKTLRQIARLDKQLTIIRRQSPSAERQEQEIQLMRDLVVEMNVFDGLAHNSDNVLVNLVEIEHKLTNKDDNDTPRAAYRRIKRLMDAKELDSPVEVYKMIQNTLADSGDAIKFKDWISKMRRQEEYFKSDPNLTHKLFMIHIRKGVIPARTELNNIRDTLSAELKKLESGWNTETFGNFVGHLSAALGEVKIVAEEFQEQLDHFIEQYPELPQITESVGPFVSKLTEKGMEIVRKLERRVEILEKRFLNPSTPDAQQKALIMCKESMSFLNSFSYLLDSI
jgi:hypothetical protein